jgi:hypothetical protein
MTSFRGPRSELLLRIAFYAAVLVALLLIYSSAENPDSHFVYTNF